MGKSSLDGSGCQQRPLLPDVDGDGAYAGPSAAQPPQPGKGAPPRQGAPRRVRRRPGARDCEPFGGARLAAATEPTAEALAAATATRLEAPADAAPLTDGANGALPSALPVYAGPFGRREAERLLWRAGFGPAPGQAQELASRGLAGAVLSLTRPLGGVSLSGPAPHDGDGNALAPHDRWGHDHLYWLDRSAGWR